MGALLARLGWAVAFGSRDRTRGVSAAQAATFPADGGGYGDVATGADLVVLATSWSDTEAALGAAGDLTGTVLLDCTNPEADEGPGLEIGTTTSGGERVASWVPGARVVKAFNHVYAELIEAGPRFGRDRATVLLCGDDDDAKALVERIARDAGFAPVDAGPLAVARFTEPAAQLMVQLVRRRGMPPADVCLHLLTRDGGSRE